MYLDKGLADYQLWAHPMMLKNQKLNPDHIKQYVRDTLISFLTVQTKKLLEPTICKLLQLAKSPRVFGSMIKNICQREKVNVPTILTKIFS